ncbi:MAG: phospholipase D-like domain-containing protein [Bacteroidia bacterium]
MKKVYLLVCVAIAFSFTTNAQNSKIKVYFNHAVNSAVSTGTIPYYTQYFQDTVAKLINNALYSVDIAQYDYTAYTGDQLSAIATACNNAAARGVVVRWIYDGNAPNAGLSLLSSGVHKLPSPTTGMATGYIMHNKFVVIDANSTTATNAIISTSSFDWSSSMATSDYNNMVVIQDQPLTQAYDFQFNQMWGGSGATPVPANEKFSTNKTVSPVNSFTVNGTPIQVYFSHMDGASPQLTNLVNSANHELYFGIYEFTISGIATSMQNKYTSGVAGFGVMDQFSTTGSNTPYLTLNQASVLGPNRLKIYTGSAIYHNKMICADPNYPSSDPQVGCGSYNWTTTASNYSDENFMVIHDATVANEYWQSLCADFHSLGGAACVSIIGIEKYDFGPQQAAVYPNPFVDGVTINMKSAGETLLVRVTDQLGKILFENKANQTDEMKLNLAGLDEGVYFVSVTSGNNHYTQKLIK